MKQKIISTGFVEHRKENLAFIEEIKTFRKMTNFVPGMIYSFMKKPDGSYSIPFSTESIRSLFGCTAQEANMSFANLTKAILPEDLDKVFSSIEDSAKNLTLWSCEFRVQLPGEPLKWLLGKSTPERMMDGSVVWAGFIEDIDDVKQNEKLFIQAQKMEVAEIIIAGVAHDFRNILAIMLGNVELLMMDDETKLESQKKLEAIHEAGQKGVGILNQLLAFSKKDCPDSHQLLDLNSLIQKSLKLLSSGEYKSIKQQWQLEPDLKRVIGNEALLSRVIINLVKNAAQAMEKTETKEWHLKTENMHLENKLYVEHTQLKPGDYVVFTLSDTGCGIIPENLERVFIPYFSTKGAQGTGLGLHVAKDIVEKQHNGAITVKSEVGKGTTIKIYLPGAGS